VRIVAAAILAALAVGCGAEDGEIRVLAASSLRDVLPAIDGSPEYAYGGSDVLATQLLEGVEADVIATAGPAPMARLVQSGAVEQPVAFATNRLVVVVPAGNPGRVRSLADLARDGLLVVLADVGVPAGDYARRTLAEAGLARGVENVASLEDDVRGVLAKVALGEADAGIVYATDVAAAGGDVESIEISDSLQPSIRYLAAVVAESGRARKARSFVASLLEERTREALIAQGFGVP
jgi:molybdate transport system substrate-binding protein